MAYQIRRTRKFYDSLELCGESGEVEKVLRIDVDIDAIATGLRSVLAKFEEAERELRTKQKSGNPQSFESTYYSYGKALVELLEMCLGTDNAAELLKFYENRYTEMAVEVCPYIIEKIIPLAGEAIKRRKSELKKSVKRRGGGR